jgi:hypothetical protein
MSRVVSILPLVTGLSAGATAFLGPPLTLGGRAALLVAGVVGVVVALARMVNPARTSSASGRSAPAASAPSSIAGVLVGFACTDRGPPGTSTGTRIDASTGASPHGGPVVADPADGIAVIGTGPVAVSVFRGVVAALASHGAALVATQRGHPLPAHGVEVRLAGEPVERVGLVPLRCTMRTDVDHSTAIAVLLVDGMIVGSAARVPDRRRASGAGATITVDGSGCVIESRDGSRRSIMPVLAVAEIAPPCS